MSPGHSGRSRLKQIGCAALVLIGLAVFVPRTVASAGIPEGVWLIDNEAAVQIFDCRNLLCGRISWLFHAILRVGWIATRKTRSRIAAASVVWLDHPVVAETYWS
jgi:hypothetical protein